MDVLYIDSRSNFDRYRPDAVISPKGPGSRRTKSNTEEMETNNQMTVPWCELDPLSSISSLRLVYYQMNVYLS